MAKVVHDAEITCLHSATLSLLHAVVRQVASQCHARMSFAVELACFGLRVVLLHPWFPHNDEVNIAISSPRDPKRITGRWVVETKGLGG